MKPIIDTLLASQTRISYRRMTAFAVACAFLMTGHLESADWVYICIAFIAGEAAPKMFEAFKRGS
tara:strand:+ start:1008 stop:1202 length:195 start_codon:yes stop_codon:yes gene_type:complete